MAISESLLEVTLTDITHGGEAVGRYEGKVVFVPYALPGERVRVRVAEARKRYIRAELVEVLEPSPQRVTPPCRHFGECGGCQWQHIAYEAQLTYKRQILRSQMTHLAALPEVSVAPVLGMDRPWNYRNHAQFSLDEEGGLGYLAARSHRVVPIEECFLLHPFLEDILAALSLELPTLTRLTLRAGVNTGDLMVIFETEEDEIPELEVDFPASFVWLSSAGIPVTLIGRDYIQEEVAGQRFRLSANSFFQVNTEQTEHLIRLVAEELAPTGDETLLDMYCGVGTFGLALADRVRAVIGMEENPWAIQDARVNAEGCSNATFLQGRVEDILPGLERVVQLAVLDPPRTGIAPEALQALIKLAPQRVAYVSCDPASLARDLKTLAEAGYAVRNVWPVDMFPQTYHVECVVRLERKYPQHTSLPE